MDNSPTTASNVSAGAAHRLPQTRITGNAETPLNDVLSDLDPIHQRFIALKFFQRLSTQQIAGVLGCSEDNVKLIQYHALKAFQGRVAR